MQAFGNWFMSYLRLFRCHQQLWMMRNPTAICGFGVDRARAETLLARQPSVPPRVYNQGLGFVGQGSEALPLRSVSDVNSLLEAPMPRTCEILLVLV